VGIHLCLNMRFWTGSFEIRRSPMCDLQTSTRQVRVSSARQHRILREESNGR